MVARFPHHAEVRETIHSKAINRAINILGGMPQLQRVLQVPTHDLIRWMNGVEEPPLPVFLRIVDVILEK